MTQTSSWDAQRTTEEDGSSGTFMKPCLLQWSGSRVCVLYLKKIKEACPKWSSLMMSHLKACSSCFHSSAHSS